MKSDFEERRANRLERFQDLSHKNANESTARFNTAHKMGEMIPMGQPILVGHHSEKGHRSHLNKIDNNMRKSIEASSKAGYYADKAKHIEKDTTIYSDDPEAIVKLKEKVAALEKRQKIMKDANKIIKSKRPEAEKVEELQSLGMSEKSAIQIMEPDYCNRIGFASYSLTNNNANINRNKKRLVQLQKLESDETTEWEINGVKVIDSVEDNRLQLYFDGKPSDAVRADLKSNGFRWSPYNGCWQTHRSQWANRKANDLLDDARN